MASAMPSAAVFGRSTTPQSKQGSHSRSTSAGSSSPGSAERSRGRGRQEPDFPEIDYPLPFAIRGCRPTFQDVEYPLPVIIKNTFLDSPSDPASLDGFLQQRDIQSCPPGAVGSPPGLEATPAQADAGKLSPLTPEIPEFDYPAPMFVKNAFSEGPKDRAATLDRPMSLIRSGLGSKLAAVPELEQDYAVAAEHTPFPSYMWEAALAADVSIDPLHALGAATLQLLAASEAPAAEQLAVPPPPVMMAPALQPAAAVPPPPLARADESRPLRVVSIADAIPEPQLGSPEAPTEGSMGHRYGNCKPCAFFHTKGCSNGIQCPFCHLCPPGERKRRQKQKLAQAAQEQKAQVQKVSIADALL